MNQFPFCQILTNFEIIKYNRLIYSFQFGFRQRHSTNHALIRLTELIESNWMIVNMVAVFSLTFRMHLILWIRIILIEMNLRQLTGLDSDLVGTICEVTQGSILNHLLFLIYMNADVQINIVMYISLLDTNLMNYQASIKTINKKIVF